MVNFHEFDQYKSDFEHKKARKKPENVINMTQTSAQRDGKNS